MICTLQTSERKGMLLITMFQGRHSDTHPLIQLARVTWAQEPATSTKTTTKGTEKIIPMQHPWLSTQIVHMYCDVQKALPREKLLEFNLNLLRLWLINFKQKVNMVKNIFTVENVGLRRILDHGVYLALAHCSTAAQTSTAKWHCTQTLLPPLAGNILYVFLPRGYKRWKATWGFRFPLTLTSPLEEY